MVAKMTPARRFVMRSALITGSTVATIIGAQNLAMMDTLSPKESDPVEFFDMSSLEQDQAQDVQLPVMAQSAAPNILILRRPGQQTASASSSAPPQTNAPQAAAPDIQIVRAQGQGVPQAQPNFQSSQSQPQPQLQAPAPVQIVPPSPVVVQQQLRPRTRRS